MSAHRSSLFSRRGILAATGSLPLVAQEAQQESAEWPRLGRRVRVGMVGLEGHPGVVYDVVAKHPDLELVAIAKDQVPVAQLTRRDAFRNTRVYDDYQSMFAREKFDVVGICNTNGHRAEVILAAVARGWHIAAEKPVALTQRQLDDVRAAVAKAGVGITSLLPLRFEPELFTMAQLVRQGAIGDILLMNAQKSYKLGSRAAWYKDAALYGSTMQWIGVHMLDSMHWIGEQRFRSIYAYEQNVGQPDLGAMQNVAGAVMQLEGGGVATLNMDYLRPDAAATHGDDRLRVAGTKGILEYRMQDGLMLLAGTNKEPVKPPLQEPANPLFLDFLLNIYHKKTPFIQPDEIYHVAQALIAGRTSTASGCAVAVAT